MSETSAAEDGLVAGRECGECTVCCKTLKIDAPELKKLADVLCDHCAPRAGCKIHESRPSICRRFYCGWRGMSYLTDHWRPDRCGILICYVGNGEGIPPEFPQLGLKFDVVESPRVLAWEPLIRFVASEITHGRPVFLGIPAPIGYERRKVFLNYALAQAVETRNKQLMIDGLMTAFQLGLADGLKEKTTFG